MKKLYFYDSDFGRFGLAEQNDALTDLFFADCPLSGSLLKRRQQIIATAEEQQTPLLREAGAQLQAYLAGHLRQFSLPLAPQGTSFRQQVWQELLAIPYGQTRSYGQIATDIGNARAARAVGSANHHNPIAIIIPCHRVVGANGRLTGYAGGLSLKERLLLLEKDALV